MLVGFLHNLNKMNVSCANSGLRRRYYIYIYISHTHTKQIDQTNEVDNRGKKLDSFNCNFNCVLILKLDTKFVH